MAVRRWRFRDVWETGPAPYEYTVEINPDEGGSPQLTKQIAVASNTGPGRAPILQEGQSDPPSVQFSGTILTREHYEALEYWADKKILLEVTDDLGRRFRCVLAGFSPDRSRRAYNPWFHRYSAELRVFSYVNASGKPVYGAPGYSPPVDYGPNLVANPSFELPFRSTSTPGFPASWHEGNADDPIEEVSIGTVTDAPHGRQVVLLHYDRGGHNGFLEQLVTDGLLSGRWVRCEASFFVDGPIEPAFWDRGLMLSVTTDDGSLHGAPGSVVQANTPITVDSPRARWERILTRVYIPPQVTDPAVQIRLYVPGATQERLDYGERTWILWDDVVLQQE
jgi:hypothetical protein